MPALHEIGTFGIIGMLILLVGASVLGGVALAKMTYKEDEKKSN